MADSTEKETIKIIVTGQVQGVFFRVTAQQWAAELDLTGYVRNCPDGSIEIVAQGSSKSLEELTQRCYHGPKAAEVTDLQVAELTPGKDFDTFDIRYD